MQKEFISKVVAWLDHAGVTYAVTGSIASNFWGVPRLTHDLDVLVMMTVEQARRVAAAIPEPYYFSREAAAEAVRLRRMVNVVDPTTNLKADLWVSAGDPFSESMLARRRRVEVAAGLIVDLASAEDVLLHKLVWNQITPSDRQIGDASGIALVQAGKLDIEYLRRWAAQQATADVLEAILAGKYLKET